MSYRTIAHHARSVRLTTSDVVFWLGSREQALPLQKVLISPKGVTTTAKLQSPKDTPLELLALLLLALPLLFTLQKLLVLPELGERSHQLFAETVTITGLDPMKNSRREVFIPLVVSFPNLGDKLCFVRDVLSKFLHGVVNPRTFFRVLENSVIEQS